MFQSLTALYVEDEEELRDVVNLFIGNFFKKCYLAKNGQDGLNIFIENEKTIDIIITDISMPTMDGLEMSEGIRQLNPKVPIIITTAHNDKDFLQKAIDINITKFITKPLDMHNLLNTLKLTLEPILLQEKLDKELKAYQEERILNAKFTATGQLAAGITHEINTPLTYIKANIEMMKYDIDDISNLDIKSNMGENLIQIVDGINRIETIVNSMKEISQQSVREKITTNIYSTIITSTILTYNKIKHISPIYINDKKFEINMDKNMFKFFAKVEIQRIEQVWIILINNAMDELVKIKDLNNRRLNINIYEKNNKIIIIFKDTAGGIDNNIIKELFEPFKNTKKSSGIGMGLSIAKRIIDDQNGATIEAYNEDNGAVFKITLSI